LYFKLCVVLRLSRSPTVVCYSNGLANRENFSTIQITKEENPACVQNTNYIREMINLGTGSKWCAGAPQNFFPGMAKPHHHIPTIFYQLILVCVHFSDGIHSLLRHSEQLHSKGGAGWTKQGPPKFQTIIKHAVL